MLRAVVFDLDYTLAVPVRDRQTLLNEATDAVGAPRMRRETYLEVHSRHLTGENRDPIFEELLADMETDVTPTELATAYREALANALVPLEGVETMLESLRETYRVGLLTNGPVLAQRDKIRTLGWEDLFDASLVTGELDAGKPDKRAFEAILAELEVEPDEAVYIGDDVEADIGGATNAGIPAIQVLLPDGPGPDPRAVAHVDQAEIATTLPRLIAELETS